MNKETKLNSTGWFIEKEREAEKTLQFLRTTRGTLNCEHNTTYAWLEGFLHGIRALYREIENDRINEIEE